MSGQDNPVKNFAQEPLAEGPLIKYTPGGTAAGRVLDTGLPPARAQLGGGEFWGQLVQPGKFTLDDTGGTTGGSGGGPIVDDPIVDDTEGLVEEDEQFWKDQNKFHDDMAYEYKPIDWEFNQDLLQDVESYLGKKFYPETSDHAYGWGLPVRVEEGPLTEADTIAREKAFRFYDYPGVRDTSILPKEVGLGKEWLYQYPGWSKTISFGGDLPTTGEILFPKLNEWLTSNQGKTVEDYQKAKDFHFYKHKYYNENNKSAIKAITGVFTEAQKFIEAAVGIRTPDLKPLQKKYAKNPIYRTSKSIEETMQGVSDAQIYLWQTKGIAADPSGKQPFGPSVTPENLQKLLQNAGTSLANSVRIIQGKDEEVKALKKLDPQKYGELQVLAIMNAAALVNAYGPYGLLPQGIVTVGQDFISAINGSIANRPELAGNPVQDILHSTMWIGGKAVQLTFNNTLGAIFPKTKIKNKPSIIASAQKNLKMNWGEQLGSPELTTRKTGITLTYDPNRKKPVVEGPKREFKNLSPLDPPTTFIQPGKPIADDEFQYVEGRDDKRDDKRRIETGGGGPITRVPSDNVPIPSDPRDVGVNRGQGQLIPEYKGDPIPQRGKDEEGVVTGTFERPITGTPVEYTEPDTVTPSDPRDPGYEDDKGQEYIQIAELDEDTLKRLTDLVVIEDRTNQIKEGTFDDATREAFTKSAINWLDHGLNPYPIQNDEPLKFHLDELANLEAARDAIRDEYRMQIQGVDFNNYVKQENDPVTNQPKWVTDWYAYEEVVREIEAEMNEKLTPIEDELLVLRGQPLPEPIDGGTVPSALELWANNPNLTAEEAVAQATEAVSRVWQDTHMDENERQDYFDKFDGLRRDISDAVFDTMAQSDAEMAAKMRSDDIKRGVNKELKEYTAKVEAKQKEERAKAKAASDKILADTIKYLKGLREKKVESGQMEKWQSDLIEAIAGGAIPVRQAKDAKKTELVFGRDEDGNLSSINYVTPEDKKLLDKYNDGFLWEADARAGTGSGGDVDLSGKTPGLYVEMKDDGSVSWYSVPKPKKPGE